MGSQYGHLGYRERHRPPTERYNGVKSGNRTTQLKPGKEEKGWCVAAFAINYSSVGGVKV